MFGFNFTERARKSLQLGNEHCQRIMSMKVGDNPMAVDLDEFEQFFDYNRNPDKGETGESERTKWLRFILQNYNIRSYPDYVNRRWMFKRFEK